MYCNQEGWCFKGRNHLMGEFKKWKFKLEANLGNRQVSGPSMAVLHSRWQNLFWEVNWTEVFWDPGATWISYIYVERNPTQWSGKGTLSKTLTLRVDRRHYQAFLYPFRHLKAFTPPSIALWITVLNASGSGPSTPDWLLNTTTGEASHEGCHGHPLDMFGSELCSTLWLSFTGLS